MRSIRKRAYAVAITFAILLASLAPGLTDTALANSAGGRRSHRSVKTKSRDKKVSRRGSRGGSRARAGRGRRRGRYARSRRSRQYVAQDSPTGRQGPAGIPSERVTEIQRALIKLGYLPGPPSGQYDDETVEAMKQFQTANQIPATGLPSAQALKRLGVPKRSNDGYAVPVKSGQSDAL